MNSIINNGKIPNRSEHRCASAKEPSIGRRSESSASMGYWRGLARRIVAWMTERLERRRAERNKSRLVLADIEESDLSELGRRIRTEVLRERGDLERRNSGSKRSVSPPSA